MADQVKAAYPGRLIAVDGTRGKDVARAARALAAALKEHGIECAVSRWDASGLFTDLAAGARADRDVSIRTLSLVYAADLAFRLRWDIRPVLEAGGIVIAASYVDTAAAFGAIGGLDEEWLRSLMRFAPAPAYRGLAVERKIGKPWKQRVDRGYAEYGALMLETTAPKTASKAARRSMIAMLERARRVGPLTSAGIDALAKNLTDNRKKAASRRSGPRPRNARK